MHPFETKGLGQAPFNCVAIFDGGEVSTTCDVCGAGLRYQCHIQSFDKKHFIVGTDCVMKLDRDDNHLITEVQRLLEKAKLEKKRQLQAEINANAAAKQQKLQQEQRDRNGGLTDHEIKQNKLEEARLEKERIFSEKNKWFIEALTNTGNDFAISVSNSLHTQPLMQGMSEKCFNICKNIYAKSKGRSGSKIYNAACDEFWNQRYLIEESA